MALVRWDPFRELEDMSARLSRLIGGPARFADDEGSVFGWAPAVDVEEDSKEYLVKADLPDVKKEDVHVNIQDGVLVVEGERRQEKEDKSRKFHRVERTYGKFVRRLTLPPDVDAAKVKAEYKEGVLRVHMPKTETRTPAAIDVQIA